MNPEEIKATVLDARIGRTMEALEKHNICAHYAKTIDDAAKIAFGLTEKGSTISCGGSVTLKESGIFAEMQSGDYRFLDRSVEGLTPEEIDELYRRSFFADVYFTSTNAITENGELYNVDGNANRVAAMCYGPRKVIVIAGANKIVRTLDEAIERVKCEAAPCNAQRLNTSTPCQTLGKCSGSGRGMTAGCAAEGRMCCQYLVTGYQRQRGRLHVIICPEALGY